MKLLKVQTFNSKNIILIIGAIVILILLALLIYYFIKDKTSGITVSKVEKTSSEEPQYDEVTVVKALYKIPVLGQMIDSLGSLVVPKYKKFIKKVPKKPVPTSSEEPTSSQEPEHEETGFKFPKLIKIDDSLPTQQITVTNSNRQQLLDSLYKVSTGGILDPKIANGL